LKKYGKDLLKYSLLFVSAFVLSLTLYKYLAIHGGIVEDDSYFYAQIAYNWGVHNLCSFDGINVTSGFHLLWGVLLAILAKIVFVFTSNKDTHLLSMFSLYFFFAFYISWEFGKNWIEKLILFFMMNFSIMMETGLLSLLFLIYFNELFTKEDYDHTAVLSVILIPLTRIDSAAIVILSSLYLLFTGQSRKYLTVMTLLSIGIAAHFSLMYYLFHHFVTVSSLYKIANPDFKHIIISNMSGYMTKRFAVFIVLSCLVLWGACKERKYSFLCVALAAIGYVLLHMFTNQGMKVWYFMPSTFIIAVVIFHLPSLYKRICYVMFVVIMTYFTAGYVYYHSVRLKDGIEWQRKFIQLVKENVRPGERIFQIDASGWTGYFCERNVINGDGLVNSYEYYDRSMNNGLKGYLKDNNVHYIITNAELSEDYIINYRGLVIRQKDVQIVVDIPHDIDIAKSDGAVIDKFRLFKLIN